MGGARVRKSPIVHRIYAVVALSAVPSVVAAQTWTVDYTVERALADPDLDRLAESRVALARAELASATAVPVPRASLAREALFGESAAEFSALVEQEFDLSGWRGALRDTLPDREAAARAETASLRLEVATEVRLAYFEVLYHEQRLAGVQDWMARLEKGAAATAARLDRGDASAFDLRRVERELATARARRGQVEAECGGAWGRLEQWVPWKERPRLTGDLTPARPAIVSGTNPVVVRLEALERATRAELDAWGLPLWRGWAVGAGYRSVESGDDVGHGWLVTLSVPLALWNTDQGRVDGLRARRARVESELRRVRTRSVRMQAAALHRLTRALDALDALPAEDGELTALALAAYDAGEISLLQLLDAYETETEFLLARTDLAWEARRAAIGLDQSRGLGALQ